MQSNFNHSAESAFTKLNSPKMELSSPPESTKPKELASSNVSLSTMENYNVPTLPTTQPLGMLLHQWNMAALYQAALLRNANGHTSYQSPFLSPIFPQEQPQTGYKPSLSQLGITPRRLQGLFKPPALKKYRCDQCGKSFSRSNTLVTHKRIHTGEKPFQCDQCGRAFRQPGNLTRHKLTHTTLKPYVCPTCGKAFNRASNLHTHMRTHATFSPFICVVCGKSMASEIDLNMHLCSHPGLPAL